MTDYTDYQGDEELDDLLDAGWSVGEADDILGHDDGDHDDEAVPGCPRCDEGMTI
jgi:hypothetical protein